MKLLKIRYLEMSTGFYNLSEQCVTDLNTIDPGNSITYSLNVRPAKTLNSLRIRAGCLESSLGALGLWLTTE